MTNTTQHPLRAERERQHLSQGELAERAEVSRWTVTRIENWQRKPTRSTTKALALALGVSPAVLRPHG